MFAASSWRKPSSIIRCTSNSLGLGASNGHGDECSSGSFLSERISNTHQLRATPGLSRPEQTASPLDGAAVETLKRTRDLRGQIGENLAHSRNACVHLHLAGLASLGSHRPRMQRHTDHTSTFEIKRQALHRHIQRHLAATIGVVATRCVVPNRS
jgi:hypothetical protein